MAETTKTEDGKAYPRSDFAYTPSDAPGSWKLRLTSAPGGPPDPRIVGAAVAALGAGFRGNKVEIPEEDRAAVISRVRAAWKKANPDKAEGDMPDVIKASEPGASSVNVPAPPEEKTKGPGNTFLSRLYAALKEHMASGESLTVDAFTSLFRSARGAAGGTVSRPKKPEEEVAAMAETMECPDCGISLPANATTCPECGWEAEKGEAYSDEGVMPWEADGQTDAHSSSDVVITENDLVSALYEPGGYHHQASDLADIAARGHTHRLFNQLSLAEAPEWIAYLPKPGTYKHPRYGEIKITPERNARFVANFSNGIYQDRLPIDAEHETKLSGAVGWVTQMRVNADGSADAKIDWTDRGRALLAADRFKYFSPEWFDLWQAPDTGKSHKDVAIGGAICSRPFFKPPALRPLVAREETQTFDRFDGAVLVAHTWAFVDVDPSEGDTMADEITPQQLADLQRQLTEQQAQFTEQQQALAAREAEIAAIRQASEAETAALKQMAEAQAEQLKQMTENHKKLERDRRTDRFEAMVHGEKWFGEYAKSLTILSNLADTFGEDHETFTAYVAQQRATAELARNSNLFIEMGSDAGGSPPTGEAQIEALTRKRMSEKGEDYATAYTATLDANPQLYTDYVKGA